MPVAYQAAGRRAHLPFQLLLALVHFLVQDRQRFPAHPVLVYYTADSARAINLTCTINFNYKINFNFEDNLILALLIVTKLNLLVCYTIDLTFEDDFILTINRTLIK